MNVAFLFNSDDSRFGGYYGPPIMERILATGVIQSVDRHMRVSVGDILTFSAAATSKTPTDSFLIELCEKVYQPKGLDLLVRDRLDATHGKATVFCWLFQNMTGAIANALHAKLTPDTAYLGAMDVDFSEPLHLSFFRNSLCEDYRLRGKRCSIFYEMGHNEDPDSSEREIFERNGFKVDYEDIGARRTIFDNFDTLEHFSRVGDFNRVFASFRGLDADQASDVSLVLEELHPRLFDAFASAARALERAETGEDLAQAALSGRRLLKRTADYLFPPREETWKERKVGKAQYRNRLWAYIDQTISETQPNETDLLVRLGTEIDRLVELFNVSLHSDPARESVEAAFRDLVVWLTDVLDLSPAHARQQYLPYAKELDEFLAHDAGEERESEGK